MAGDRTDATTTEPDVELYAAEALDGGGEDGMRIYRSDDTVFEAWTVDDTAVRLYEEDGAWRVTVRFPEDDIEEGYNRFIRTAEDINDAYGTALDISPKRFRERHAVDGEVVVEDEDTTLRYREETELEELVDRVAGDPTKASVAKGVVTDIAAETAEGTVIGALVGSIAGPPGVAATATAWGGIWGGISVIRNGWNLARGGAGPRATTYFEERRKDGYKAIDVVEEHLASVNRLHSLEAEIGVTREMDMEKHEELEELEESGVDDVHDLLIQLHFRRYEDGDGVMAVYEADTYGDAAGFVTTVTGNTIPWQQPSLYTDLDAFQTVFDHLTYTERGAERYLDDAAVLAQNAYDRGSEEVVAWLEQEHQGLVHDAAPR